MEGCVVAKDRGGEAYFPSFGRGFLKTMRLSLYLDGKCLVLEHLVDPQRVPQRVRPKAAALVWMSLTCVQACSSKHPTHKKK